MEFKILSITCDNASNNDKMIEHLSTLVDDFPGAANQTRCFSHVLNLVAKSILRQFDVPKKNSNVATDLNDAANVLAGLTQELELDETVDNNFETDNENEEDLTNNDDDQSNDDDHEGMSEEEVSELEETLVPVWLMLAKVTFKLSPYRLMLIHRLTLILIDCRSLLFSYPLSHSDSY